MSCCLSAGILSQSSSLTVDGNISPAIAAFICSPGEDFSLLEEVYTIDRFIDCVSVVTANKKLWDISIAIDCVSATATKKELFFVKATLELVTVETAESLLNNFKESVQPSLFSLATQELNQIGVTIDCIGVNPAWPSPSLPGVVYPAEQIIVIESTCPIVPLPVGYLGEAINCVLIETGKESQTIKEAVETSLFNSVYKQNSPDVLEIRDLSLLEVSKVELQNICSAIQNSICESTRARAISSVLDAPDLSAITVASAELTQVNLASEMILDQTAVSAITKP